MTEYYSAFERKEILIRTTTQMNLQDVKLVKEASLQRTILIYFYF